MSQPTYKLREGSLQDTFLSSRAKVRIYGGGYANGKTSAACILALSVAQDYPGANILLARSTYPKLEDTLRVEFFKWCPESWIKTVTQKPNNCVLTNGSVINFRYVAQQGSNVESTTSNLLSATYDLIIVDQIEDPEFVYKDFLDLMGRLRGSAKYIGHDRSMPSTGPRWIVLTTNPTRNWVYQKLVKPLHDYQKGLRNKDLLVDVEGKPIIHLIEGSTYTNKDNLPADYIATLESTYQGQMKERFLKGQWGAYEGLIYPAFDQQVHMVDQNLMMRTIHRLQSEHVKMTVMEGYDYGLAVPSCYLLGLCDTDNNVFIIDGFYHPEMEVGDQAKLIEKIRTKHGIDPDSWVCADPDIFRRKPGSKTLLSQTVADMFADDGIQMIRAENAVMPGIVKIRQYLAVQKHHVNPFYGTSGSPHLFFSSHLDFITDEISMYAWKKDTGDEATDEPIKKKDHSLDALKYLFTKRPELAKVVIPFRKRSYGLTVWAETEDEDNHLRKRRYG